MTLQLHLLTSSEPESERVANFCLAVQSKLRKDFPVDYARKFGVLPLPDGAGPPHVESMAVDCVGFVPSSAADEFRASLADALADHIAIAIQARGLIPRNGVAYLSAPEFDTIDHHPGIWLHRCFCYAALMPEAWWVARS